MKKLICENLMPEYKNDNLSNLIFDPSDNNDTVFVQVSAHSNKHYIAVDADCLLVGGNHRAASYLSWTQAEFIIPYKFDQLVEEFIQCDAYCDDLYILDFGSVERNVATTVLWEEHVKKYLAIFLGAMIFLAVLNPGLIPGMIEHWIMSLIFIVISCYFIFPEKAKYAEKKKGEVNQIAKIMIEKNHKNRMNRISIPALKYSAILGPDMMDARLLKEIIAYSCKAHAKMREIM